MTYALFNEKIKKRVRGGYQKLRYKPIIRSYINLFRVLLTDGNIYDTDIVYFYFLTQLTFSIRNDKM